MTTETITWGAPDLDAPDTTDPLATLIGERTVTDARRASLARAIELGADEYTLCELVRARRVSKSATIVLPPHRFERLSRGRGWARKGSHATATWGEREENGYRVGPGRWVVGGSDGFSRKGQDTWTVEHVQVGSETWTIAD